MELTKHPGSNPSSLFLWPNLLGLDAPMVAICWQWFFARVFQINLPTEYYHILGLSVWCIYIGDRLYDAKRAENTKNGTRRLLFTKKHFRLLALTCFLMGVTNLFLIFIAESRELVRNGLILSVFVAIYYGLRISGKHRLAIWLPREIMCGFLFAAGTALATWTLAPPILNQGKFALAVTCFALLCSVNCILISIWEKEQDAAVCDFSIANRTLATRRAILSCSFTLIFVSGISALIGPLAYYLAIGLGAIGLSFLAIFQKRFSQDTLRILADVSLLTPFLISIFTD